MIMPKIVLPQVNTLNGQYAAWSIIESPTYSIDKDFISIETLFSMCTYTNRVLN